MLCRPALHCLLVRRQHPEWHEQTLFLATRGATDVDMKFCFADDMVQTRVGFVLSSFTMVRNVSYQVRHCSCCFGASSRLLAWLLGSLLGCLDCAVNFSHSFFPASLRAASRSPHTWTHPNEGH